MTRGAISCIVNKEKEVDFMTRKRFSAFLLASALLLVFLTNVVFADGGKKKQTILTSGTVPQSFSTA